uniref:CARD domain-containing protein n=1 Tax=Oncorhynchus kisutch TaxID=8019 RepID=A0A8C7JGL0_ONCKI
MTGQHCNQPRGAQQLQGLRTKFIEKVSKTVLDQLMDDLLEDMVLNDGEIEEIKENNMQRADKARQLIDSVRRKGNTASEKFLIRLQERDKNVYSELNPQV